MKRVVLVLLAAVLVAGCGFLPIVQGSGVPATSLYGVGSYSRFSAEQGCSVIVVQDAVPSLRVTIDDNLVDYLEVTQQGTDGVAIGLKPGYLYSGITFSAEVHVPFLTGIDLSGGSQVVVLTGQPPVTAMGVTLSGGSTADLRQVGAGTLSVDLSGGSVLTASGSGPTVQVSASGGSSAHLLDYTAHAAAVDLSGASECWLTLGGGTVDLRASGASTLYYRGTASLRLLDMSGASRLVQVP